jgi:hypothetical protein
MRRITRARPRQKVGAVLPAQAALIDQRQVSFVHEAGCLERVIGTFPLEILPREPAQLVINERHEALRRIWIVGVPGDQHLGDFLEWRRNHAEYEEYSNCSSLSNANRWGRGRPSRPKIFSRSVAPSSQTFRFRAMKASMPSTR